MAESKFHVPNLERALSILQMLSEKPQGLTQKELIDALAISKNSVYRITMTLMEEGYIARDETSRCYYLTRKMMILGASAMGDSHLVEKSIDEMRELRDQVNASIYLAVLEGTTGVILEQAIGGSPFKFSVDLGTRFNLHSGAPGKALLAFLPPEEAEELMSKLNMVKFNSRTITTKKAMREQMEIIRKRGYAIDMAEEFEGCHCIGTVIRDHRNYPIAMIWATGSSFNITADRFEDIGAKLLSTAEKISRKFGFLLP
ncbi:IclR family transcriptional regulator [Luteolibacter algae]|uniref:IclR family transcriptional regulator n=1 Tax=Luteolibacter algae TaxID=454151 RepID=A0ABW5D2F4_9BACT